MEEPKKIAKTKPRSMFAGQKEFNQAQLLEFVHHDYETARRFYEKACKAGHPMAQYQYGLWFADVKGERIKPDEIKARKLFEASAENGHGIAQVALAQMYETGRGGLKQDESMALYWYKEAVKNPSSIARENISNIYNKIAFMYMEGVGTMKDVNKALKWFKKAEMDSNLSQTVQSLLETLAKVNP
ncbi:sel1 repeat family, partial [Paramuricea clavata]